MENCKNQNQSFEFSPDPIIRVIQNDLINYKQGYSVVVCGMMGSGKSLAALELCRLVDPTFTIERVAYTIEDFLNLINMDLPAGSAILWDESNIDNDAKNAMTIENKEMDKISQTIRSHSYFIVMTTPSQSFENKRTRILINIYVEMYPFNQQKYYFKNELSIACFQRLQQNYKYMKTYFKNSRFIADDGLLYELRPVLFRKPPQDLVDAYNSRKKEFKKQMYSESSNKILEQKKPKVKTPRVSNQDIVDYIKKNKIGIGEAALKFNLGSQKQIQIKRIMKDKHIK